MSLLHKNRAMFTRDGIDLQHLTPKKFRHAEVKQGNNSNSTITTTWTTPVRISNFLCHSAGMHKFSQNAGPQIYRRQKSDMKQVPY